MIGIYEYCGIQRCGKSTLMMCDTVCKLLSDGYEPEEINSNFMIKIPGVKCYGENRLLIEEVLRWKREKVRHKVILFDECGQELRARSYMDKVQTEFVNFAWQMPKMDIVMMYCSNPGNSADIILRDATWFTIMPKYHKGLEHKDDFIEVTVIYNYERRIESGLVVSGFQGVQNLFDTYQPIS